MRRREARVGGCKSRDFVALYKDSKIILSRLRQWPSARLFCLSLFLFEPL